ncbi:MAG: HD domain-containing phosphohydrolase [Pyrinomonadaceae bacterium]
MSALELLSSDKLTIDEDQLQTAIRIDDFEGYPHPHAARIAVLADAVARQFDLAIQDRLSLQQAALFHDIGEMVMNREYIHSGQVLGDEQRMDLQRHPVIGEQETAKRGMARSVQLIVRWHHEWWNGSGYPDGLERECIPLGSRILRVVDTYAALTDARPFSVPISEDEAKRYISEWAGIEFDPKVARIFLALQGIAELKSFAEIQ